MDPTATLKLAVDALRELAEKPTSADTRDEAVQALRNLASWLEGGGFSPDVDKVLGSTEVRDDARD
tara:strand:- start:4659 stop:4856 length:198 start_codon:yes stop_codon:yes gene_type:complete